jgi:hypothetical protein
MFGGWGKIRETLLTNGNKSGGTLHDVIIRGIGQEKGINSISVRTPSSLPRSDPRKILIPLYGFANRRRLKA